MRRTLTLLTLSFALASPAFAQGRNSQAPINLNADHIELQDKANRALFTGNVVVKQAEMTLNAQRMTVSYAGQISTGASPEAQRIDASGGVVVTRPTQTARSNFAVYDLKKGVITMLGAVTLIQAGNTVNGGRLTINLDTGRAIIDGSSVGGGGSSGAPGTTTSSNGRVSGTFSVPKRN
ncbi:MULTISPECIES: LptA/OstA family protein [unclassified Sphingomonas]|uniref:LptA/OstA family protein n=1 Tax=unclassified Sphingomonas TaxID=196159 RepID=UPI00028A1B8E|nr:MULTISPECIES: LptA/OstA family protein [unclassified Sphingomonas]